jgi:hypothetical protein
MNIKKMVYWGSMLAGGLLATGLALGAISLKKEGAQLRKAANEGAFGQVVPRGAQTGADAGIDVAIRATNSIADAAGRALALCPPDKKLCDLATQTASRAF